MIIGNFQHLWAVPSVLNLGFAEAVPNYGELTSGCIFLKFTFISKPVHRHQKIWWYKNCTNMIKCHTHYNGLQLHITPDSDTPWVKKKGCHPNHGYNFVNSWSICKILSLLQTALNFQQNSYWVTHHTLSMLLHYLAKLKNQKFALCMHAKHVSSLIFLSSIQQISAKCHENKCKD